MKRKPSVLLLTLILTLVTLVSCKKYEDGPILSFRSKKERIANSWRAETTTRDGNTLAKDAKVEQAYFNKDGEAIVVMNGILNVPLSLEGTWEFDESKESINLDLISGSEIYQDSWKITRLKENSLWVNVEDSTGLFKIQFHSPDTL